MCHVSLQGQLGSAVQLCGQEVGRYRLWYVSVSQRVAHMCENILEVSEVSKGLVFYTEVICLKNVLQNSAPPLCSVSVSR